jgi:hypothetical protein
MATVCTVSREQFASNAKHLTVVIMDHEGKELLRQHISPTEFSTKSLGFNLNAKLDLPIGLDTPRCQVGMNVTLIGSKELPARKPATDKPAGSIAGIVAKAS